MVMDTIQVQTQNKNNTMLFLYSPGAENTLVDIVILITTPDIYIEKSEQKIRN